VISIPPRPADFQFSEAKSPRLHIISYSSVAANCIVRGLTQKGLIHYPFTTNALRTAENWYIPLTEIPLSVLVLTTTTGIQRGITYVQVYLEITGVPVTLLTADYITTAQPISWPDGNISAPTQGRGYIRTYQGTNPAAGDEITETCPTNSLWRIIAANYSLVTSADVGTRTSRLRILSALGADIFNGTPNDTQLASLTRNYWWYDMAAIPAAWGSNIFGQIPSLFITAGGSIITDTDGIFPADNYGPPIITVEEWLNP
jgi:hypothetical protein